MTGPSVCALWLQAYAGLCRSRKRAGHNADIWDLRLRWEDERETLFQQVMCGRYRLAPVRYAGGAETLAQWSARDALVLKWVALRIKGMLPVQPACAHVAGRRGGRDSLSTVAQAIRDGAKYVYRTDIRGYYRHINKQQLFWHLYRFVEDSVLHELLHQYIHYSVEEGGDIHTPQTGICRSCALSPLTGASFLWYVDIAFQGRNDLTCVRYMDDFLFLSDRRWPVRRARKKRYDFFEHTDFECHPDKTQAGGTAPGFYWLGVWFTDDGATGIAPGALENHRLRRLLLEEQSRRSGLCELDVQNRVQLYERRWKTWAESQLFAAE